MPLRRSSPVTAPAGKTAGSVSPANESRTTRLLARMLGRPILLWAGYLVLVTIIALVARMMWPEVKAGPSGVSGVQVGLQTLIVLIVVPFAAVAGAKQTGLKNPVRVRHLAVLAFPILTVVYGYTTGFRDLPMSAIVLALASALLAGVGEELAFRGILLPRLLPAGVGRAVLLSSLLFGLLHLSNLALGASLPSTVLQVVFAALAGCGYAAMRLRTGSLWPAIVLHAAFDLTFRVGNIEPGSMHHNIVFMLHGVGWAVYALIVLRPAVRQQAL